MPLIFVKADVDVIEYQPDGSELDLNPPVAQENLGVNNGDSRGWDPPM